MANQQVSSSAEPTGTSSLARASADGAQRAGQTAKDAVEAAAASAHDAADRIGQRTESATRDMIGAGALYRDSSGFAADRLNALLSSFSVLANGAQEFQHEVFEVWQHSMETAVSSPGEFLQCRSLSEVAELQRDLLRKGLDGWLDANSKLLRLSGRIAERAVAPIEQRVSH